DIITAHIEPEKLKGNKIAFCGGGMSACDSALEAAINGKDVTIIEMLDNIAGKELIPNKMALIPMLMKNKVKIITGHKVLEVKVNGVNTQKSDGSNVFIDADTVVSAFGMIPDSSIADEIKEIYKNKVFIIGDCNHVGKCGDAIRAGMFAAISI
ncbi:MAG: FAD-dependent oxidoreductase, partial [Dysgonamonadaceae bacterium]|nr:FAD-dependent oxidoreductase [Dysgonamonadaceae bacterium]